MRQGEDEEAADRAQPIAPEAAAATVDPHNKVIPSLFHQLVLADPTRKYLNNFNVSIWNAVRAWARLPHDTLLAAFYANAKDSPAWR